MTKIIVTGKIEFIQKKEYEGKEIFNAQFVLKNEKKGFEIIKIKLTETPISQVKEGDNVSIPVSLSAMNSSTFFKQAGKIELLKG